MNALLTLVLILALLAIAARLFEWGLGIGLVVALFLIACLARCFWHFAYLSAKVILLQKPTGVFNPLQFCHGSSDSSRSTIANARGDNSTNNELLSAGNSFLLLAKPYPVELMAIGAAIARIWTFICLLALGFAITANLLNWETAFPQMHRILYITLLLSIPIVAAGIAFGFSKQSAAEWLIRTVTPLSLLSCWAFLAASTPLQLPTLLSKADQGRLFSLPTSDFEADFQLIESDYPYFRERVLTAADRYLSNQLDIIEQTGPLTFLAQDAEELESLVSKKPFSVLIELDPSLQRRLDILKQHARLVETIKAALNASFDTEGENNIERLKKSLDELESIDTSFPAAEEFAARAKSKLRLLNDLTQSL